LALRCLARVLIRQFRDALRLSSSAIATESNHNWERQLYRTWRQEWTGRFADEPRVQAAAMLPLANPLGVKKEDSVRHFLSPRTCRSLWSHVKLYINHP
jgi:hypothetical protein